MTTKTNSILDLATAIAALGGKPVPAAAQAKPVLTASNSNHFIDARIERQLQLVMARKQHFSLVGPRGCGKSSLLRHLFVSNGIPYLRIQCDKSMDTEELIGSNVAQVINGEQQFLFQWGPLITAMEQGMAVILEEVDSLQPDRSMSLFSVLDDSPEYTAVVQGNTKHIVKTSGFFVGTTSNTAFNGDLGEYAGTEVMNKALVDRIENVILVDYLPPMQEIELIVQRSGIDKDLAVKMVSVATETREKAAGNKGIEALSSRRLLSWAKNVVIARKSGIKLNVLECARMAFIDQTENENAKAALAKAVTNKFGV